MAPLSSPPASLQFLLWIGRTNDCPGAMLGAMLALRLWPSGRSTSALPYTTVSTQRINEERRDRDQAAQPANACQCCSQFSQMMENCSSCLCKASSFSLFQTRQITPASSFCISSEMTKCLSHPRYCSMASSHGQGTSQGNTESLQSLYVNGQGQQK